MGVSNLPAYSDELRTLEDQSRGEKWAWSALEAETTLVACASSGGRNMQLNNAALKLGHKVGSGYLRSDEVKAALMDAALQCGLLQEDGAELPWLVKADRAMVEMASIVRSLIEDTPAAVGAAMIREYRQQLSALGATPTARSKVNDLPAQVEEIDPWAQFEMGMN